MYKIYMNDILIHSLKSKNLILDNPDLEMESNQPGSLSYSVFPNHKEFSKFTDNSNPLKFEKMKAIVKVYREKTLIFRGRMLENKDGLYGQKQVVCEGELAFFIDSKLRPYANIQKTPKEHFTYYINEHNKQMARNPEKQFVIGNVSELIKDGDTSNTNNLIDRSSENIVSTWEEISTKLIEKLGGYLIIDSVVENGVEKRRINWVHESELPISSQEIKYGKNLLDININVKGDEIATALIPLGGKGEAEGSKQLDITSITGEIVKETEEGTIYKVSETEDDEIYKLNDFIYSKNGVEKYGWIFDSITYDDIKTDTQQLLRNGIETLNQSKKAIESIELVSVDLYKIQEEDPFSINFKIKVTSENHNLKGEIFPLTKIKIKLSNPASNTLTLTKTERTFTETSIKANKTQNELGNIVERVETVETNVKGVEEKTNNSIAELTEELSSKIEQSSEQIITKVSQEYFTKNEAEKLVQSVSTEFEQTAESFEMKFNQVNADIEDVIHNANDHYQEQVKYIRFKDGVIYIGEEGNELILKQQNDRISFLENGVEVAYFSNRKLYVLDGEFINSLKLGNFAFVPRITGNLSFKKVT